MIGPGQGLACLGQPATDKAAKSSDSHLCLVLEHGADCLYRHILLLPSIRMAENGGPRRTERRATTARRSKKLGRIPRLAIRHNHEEAEKFIDDAVAGTVPDSHSLGLVMPDSSSSNPGAFAFGDGSFSVKVAGGHGFIRAPLRGLLKGRGKFHHNPNVTTAPRNGSYVVVVDGTIFAVLSTGQASRARRALGMSSGGLRSSSSGSSNGFAFTHRGAEGNVANLNAMVASLDPTTKKSKSKMTQRRHEGAPRSSSSEKKKKAHGGAGGGAKPRSWFSRFF
jgi:hypothetical protein